MVIVLKSNVTLQNEKQIFCFIHFCSAIASFYNLKLQEEKEYENSVCLLLKLQEVGRNNITKRIVIIHTEPSNTSFRA